MAGKTRLGANFGIDVSNLKAGLKTANALIRESESEFKKAAAGMDDWTKSQDGLEKKIESLNKIADIQKQKVEALKKQYEQLVAEGLDETSDRAIKLRTELNKEETALGKTEGELVKTKTALQNFGKESENAKTDVKNLADETDKGTGKFGAMQVALGNLVSKGITAAVDGFKKLATEAVNAYKEVDEGSDNVIKATGATGKQAEDLQRSYENVAKSIKGDFGDIGNVLGEVNTRFGFTGDTLEEATKNFLKFADITGTDAKGAVASVSKALKAAGMQDKDYAKLLDQMAKAAQDSGVSVDTLADKLTKNGSTFRALGFNVEETIAMLAQFEAAGVNTDAAITGLSTSVKNWGSEGKNAKEEFDKAMAAIAAAPTDTEKAKIAFDTFGKKAGTELADAITTGRTNYTDFVNTLKNSEGTVKTTYENTQDGFDAIDVAIQGVKTDMGAFVGELAEEYGPTIQQGFGMIGDAAKGATTFVFDFTSALGETLGEVYLWCEKVAGRIGDFFKNAWDGVESFVAKAHNSIWGSEWLDDVKDALVSDDVRKAYENATGRKISDFDWYNYKTDLTTSRTGSGGHFAKGGVVRHATQAIIGEAGAEVVMPLENNTGWIDKLAERIGAQIGGGVTVNQTNNYTSAHSRYELWKSKQEINKAIKLARG